MSNSTIEPIEVETAEFADDLGDEALDRTSEQGRICAACHWPP